jgi:predicted protein tyrosine phosphatase
MISAVMNIQNEDEETLLLQNEEEGMSRLDENIDCVSTSSTSSSSSGRIFISSARGARNVMMRSNGTDIQVNIILGENNNNNEVTKINKDFFSLVITAARSLLPKQPTSEEQFLTLDVVSKKTTEEDCSAFFERILPVLVERCNNNKVLSRIYIALDDNPSQDIRPVILPFAKFLAQYLKLTAATNSSILCHCVLGKSRSVALIAGYLMFGAEDGKLLMLADALDMIRKTRNKAEVNPVFGAAMFALWAKAVKKERERKRETKNE